MSEEQKSQNRQLIGISKTIVSTIALAVTVFELYTSGFGFYPNIIQRSIVVGLIIMLSLAVLPRTVRDKNRRIPATDLLLMVAVLAATAYTVISYERIIMDPANSTVMDRAMSVFWILVIIESSRRALGWVFPILVAGMLLYAFAGPLLPGIWGHPGFGLRIILETMYMTTNGIWGTITGITATVVAVFVILGAILLQTGGGKTFIDIAVWAAGKTTGGAAKIATLASCLFGTINGNGPANVAATGTFTIPMMKRVGYVPEFAAGVEATASSGGQIMPPVMGAGAFVMAEIIGVPYAKIALSALFPALLYYLGCWATIHFTVLKGLSVQGRLQADTTVSPRELLSMDRVLPLLIPLSLLIVLLFTGYTAGFAGCWASFGALAFYLMFSRSKKDFGMRLRGCVKALEQAGLGLITIGALIASAQIVVTLISLTGVGIKLSQMLMDLSHGSLFISLFLAMTISLILGMGIPTVAAYVLCAAVVAPALTSLGLTPLTAHMFIFYFAVISAITPPVCPSVYVAASIGQCDWIRTAKFAIMLGLAGFLVPFVFVYSPGLLLQGNVLGILKAIASGTVGVIAIAAGVSGFLILETPIWQRVLLIAGSVLLLEPSFLGDLIGYVTVALIGLQQYLKKRRLPAQAESKTLVS
jgi:TRAP transporter 4TM/12TM fusion protein